MKKFIRLIISVVFLLIIINPGKAYTQSTTDQEGTLKLLCSADLFDAVSVWAADYQQYNTGVDISVELIKDGSIEEEAGGGLMIASRWNYTAKVTGPAWKLLIGHEVIVPAINVQNPYIIDLQKAGVKVEDLNRLFSGDDPLEWGSLLQEESHMILHMYIADAETVKASIGDFIGDLDISSGSIKLIPELKAIEMLRNDPYAIVFSRMGMLIDPENHEILSGIRLLPIDRNSNGRIDHMENIYTDANTMARGVWIGKYPKELVNNIYILSDSRPTAPCEVAFLEWVLSDGQDQVERYGYSSLISSERLGQLAKLRPSPPLEPSVPDTINTAELIAYILLGLLVIILIYFIASSRFSRVKPPVVRILPKPEGAFSEGTITALPGLHYDRTHTWAFMEMDGCVKVGIDDFLQNVIGRITRLKMKDEGDIIKRGEPFLSVIQRGKQLTLYAPVSGMVRKTNPKLYRDSTMVNSSPFGDGWIYMIEPDNWAEEVKHLQTSARYREWLKKEFVRMKDFLTAVLTDKHFDMSMIIIQDGGAIRNNVLAEMGPEVWADFQDYFLDLSK